MTITYRVVGRPVPQGSMVASYNRKMGVSHVHHTQGAALAQWRSAVRDGAYQTGADLTSAPVAIWVEFGMPRPKMQTTLRAGKRVVKTNFKDSVPAVTPDLDKLVRAVLDALTSVCYYDDAQVVSILASKVYRDYTEIRISEYREVAFTQDAERLGENSEDDTREGQLRLPDMR